VSKGRLVLLATALAVMAYVTVARDGASPAAHGNAATGPGAIEGGAATPGESRRALRVAEAPPPEAETIIVLPRSPRGEMHVSPHRVLPGDPTRLVLEVQRELKRVGCYSQELNGEWSPATQRAMRDFTERVNAVLPLQAPDLAFLALLQSERTAVCGATCPVGQDLTKDGRCLPTALLALPAAKVAALLERADIKTSAGDTTASTPTPANQTGAAPQAAHRMRHRPGNFGSWLSGLFGW
jgi:peptidoglycan hydrolase-like protein with peptidoglycan-binding domain